MNLEFSESLIKFIKIFMQKIRGLYIKYLTRLFQIISDELAKRTTQQLLYII